MCFIRSTAAAYFEEATVIHLPALVSRHTAALAMAAPRREHRHAPTAAAGDPRARDTRRPAGPTRRPTRACSAARVEASLLERVTTPKSARTTPKPARVRLRGPRTKPQKHLFQSWHLALAARAPLHTEGCMRKHLGVHRRRNRANSVVRPRPRGRSPWRRRHGSHRRRQSLNQLGVRPGPAQVCT